MYTGDGIGCTGIQWKCTGGNRGCTMGNKKTLGITGKQEILYGHP